MNEPIHKILVPTDGSPASEAVFPAVMPLVRAYKPEVLLFYVFEDPDEAPHFSDQVRWSGTTLKTAGVNVRLLMRAGNPAQEILRIARSEKVDLIAMATQGRRGVPRLFAGSVAEEVLRHSDLPLLVTRPGVQVREWNTIVVALDGSARAEEVLPDAVRLARRMGASLQVLQVTLPIVASVMAEVPIVLAPEDPWPYLNRILARLQSQGVRATAVALEGTAATEILGHLETSGASLLCMSTHGRSGLSRLLLGSVAEEVLRRSPCPVLLRRTVAAEAVMEPLPLGVVSAT